MGQFVRFIVNSESRFKALGYVFDEIKAIKNLDYQENIPDDAVVNYNIDQLRKLMPSDIQQSFDWPGDSPDQQIDRSLPMRIAPPGAHSGKRWAFATILDLIDMCDYALTGIQRIDSGTAEMHVETFAYPYGGLNALIALIEGFGFKVIGVSECGVYEPLDEVP